jgi:hypothetical protein
MLPLNDPVLSLEEIAEYWSREIGGILTREQVYENLLSNFWRGILFITDLSGANKIDRVAMLEIVSRSRHQPGVSLLETDDDRPPAVEQMLDGGFRIDPIRYIALPSDVPSWTNDLVEAACTQLATVSFDDFDDQIKTGLKTFCTNKDSLRGFCEAMGWPVPFFWFGKDRPGKWNSSRELDAEAWFKRIAAGPKRKAKAGYLADARKEFPGIPNNAFYRIWKEHTSAAWTRPGPHRS